MLDEGDPFTKINLEKSVSKIRSRNIFNNVKSEITDGSENNLKIINIEVSKDNEKEIYEYLNFYGYNVYAIKSLSHIFKKKGQ